MLGFAGIGRLGLVQVGDRVVVLLQSPLGRPQGESRLGIGGVCGQQRRRLFCGLLEGGVGLAPIPRGDLGVPEGQ